MCVLPHSILGRNAAMRMTSLLFGVGVVLIGASAARADNWPSWRGPDNNGISREAPLPAKWSASSNVLWKVPLPGKGGSTPIVWGERIFLTSGDGRDLALLCIGADGKEIWKRKLGAAVRQSIKG